MAWELNPEFALQSRLGFWRGARYAWEPSGFAVAELLLAARLAGVTMVLALREWRARVP